MGKQLTPKQERELKLEKIRETYPQKFGDYVDEQIYLDSKVIPIEPMTAKEPLNEEQQEEMFYSDQYLVEVKKDGTRGTLHLRKEGNRLFSRRISKKTNWYSENTDSVPHIRDLHIPKHLLGTILDGELSIPNGDFKDISSIMNCLWDEAILRQEELERKVQLNAFDIIYYKGVYVAKMPLLKRKKLLKKVVEEINSPYIRLEEWYHLDNPIVEIDDLILTWLSEHGLGSTFPLLEQEVYLNDITEVPFKLELSRKAFYEYVVLTGGEGLMAKPVDGIYKHTRGREYTKIKKFTTREVVCLGFTPPTEEYEGKEIDTWQYWGMYRQGHLEEIIEGEEPSPYTRDHQVLPVTKHFAKDWVGNIKYGIVVTGAELVEWQKKNPKEKPITTMYKDRLILDVGECSGFDEETREYFTNNQVDMVGKVIEIKAHEVLKTGKLRHPRFLRIRDDKSWDMCIYKDHMEGI